MYSSLDNGIGCLLSNINTIGNGWPFLTIFALIYFVTTILMLKANNHFIKSFTASTFLMWIIATLSYVIQKANNMPLVSERTLIFMIVILSAMTAINVYLSRNA